MSKNRFSPVSRRRRRRRQYDGKNTKKKKTIGEMHSEQYTQPAHIRYSKRSIFVFGSNTNQPFGLFHQGPVHAVHLVVQPTRVAQVVSGAVAPPQRRGNRSAVHALATHAKHLVDCNYVLLRCREERNMSDDNSAVHKTTAAPVEEELDEKSRQSNRV